MDTKFKGNLTSRSSGEQAPPHTSHHQPWTECQIHLAGPAHVGVLKVTFPESRPVLPPGLQQGQEEVVLAVGWPGDLQCEICSVPKQDLLWADWVSSLVTDLSPEREVRTSGFMESL